MPDARPANALALCLKSGHCPQMPLPDFERCGNARARPPAFFSAHPNTIIIYPPNIEKNM